MKTIRQVAEFTGVSIRTLQYYDEIGLLKPSALTSAGYRLYDDAALQRLQQILFFKELDFPLKEIRDILENPEFDRIAAFHKQKELLLIKRSRMERLIQLLERLEKGENCMSFQEFDLSDYMEALEHFKNQNEMEILKYWGSMENFERFLQKIKEDEPEIARLAIKHFGSIEAYTEAMRYNLEHFSEIMDTNMTEEVQEIGTQSEQLYKALTADLTRDASSPEVQGIVQEILDFIQAHGGGVSLHKPYVYLLIDAYSSDYVKAITDQKYGEGASAYIVRAFRAYAKRL